MSEVAEHNYIRDLLDCVDIETVYSVDDRHAPDHQILITIGRELSAAKRAELLGREGEEATYAEFDIFRKHLEELLDSYGETKRTALVQRAQQMVGDTQVADDTVVLTKLGELMADRVQPLSKADWQAREDEILNSDKPALVLFDRDFAPEGGGANEGEDLIRQIQHRSSDKPIWTGLLTHTISRDQEHQTYLELGERGIDLQRVIVISKARVNPDEFPAHLRLTLLAPLLHRLLLCVSKKLTETTEAAVEETTKVLPVELESMVFGSSEVEGVWPPETLMLLFALLQRDAARAKIWDDEQVRDLTKKVQCLGAVKAGLPVADRAIGEQPGDSPSSNDGGELSPAVPRFYQRRQIYADMTMVNRLHLPIECGDIFCNTAATSKRWVVIAQPCDLAVRTDGVRGDFPITHVVLAPIHRLKEGGNPRPEEFKLPYFEQSGQHAVAQLNRARYQRIWLLDLGVFDSGGHAVLDVSATDPPDGLLDGWAARYARLRQDADAILAIASRNDEVLRAGLRLNPPADTAEIEALSADTRQAIATDHANAPFMTALDPAAGVLDAGCQRIGRLTDEYARALLTRWGAHLSRPVLPYDLTRQPDYGRRQR